MHWLWSAGFKQICSASICHRPKSLAGAGACSISKPRHFGSLSISSPIAGTCLTWFLLPWSSLFISSQVVFHTHRLLASWLSEPPEAPRCGGTVVRCPWPTPWSCPCWMYWLLQSHTGLNKKVKRTTLQVCLCHTLVIASLSACCSSAPVSTQASTGCSFKATAKISGAVSAAG